VSSISLFQKRFFPKAYAKFNQVPNKDAWKKPTFDFLESVIMRIETRNGRLNPTIVSSKEAYDQEPQQFLRAIENGTHFRCVIVGVGGN
jgi:hypothetical protein